MGRVVRRNFGGGSSLGAVLEVEDIDDDVEERRDVAVAEEEVDKIDDVIEPEGDLSDL